MRPPKVAIDLRLAGHRTGGIARYANDLYAALRALPDLSVTAIQSRTGTPTDDAVRFRTPPHHRLERYSIAVEMALSRKRFDVYHATDFIAPRIPRTATVATVHDLAFMQRPEDLEKFSLDYYKQISAARRWTDAWITPSLWTAENLSEHFDIDPGAITVIQHGIPLNLQRQPIVSRADRGGYILAVGTIEPRKRYDLLLDGLALMVDRPRLEVAGKPGWNSETTERRLENTDGVTWRRNVDDVTLRELYRNAYAVVVPSHTEGFGFAALEAMACGTPVISSNQGALQEVTELAALVAEGDDPHSWAGAIERIYDDEQLWNELSAFGRRRAQEFSWSRAARETTDIYDHLAGH
ncbi:glycosyltransferase family 1 protein [soil metagenome]